MKHGRLSGLLVAVLAAASAVGCRNDPAAVTAGSEDRQPAREVRVVLVARGTLPRVIAVTGTLAAEEQVALGMKVAGRLSEVAVDLGSRAAKGQPLARLVPTDFELRVAQAEAALEQARARLGLDAGASDEHVNPEATALVRQASAMRNEARLSRERAQRLFEEQLVSRADLDSAIAASEVADGRYQDALEEILNRQAVLAQRRTELELARQQLEDSVLYAPFDGAVRERQASPGQFVAVGQPIVTLVRMHPLRLRLAVPERDAAGVRQGQEVRLTVEGDRKVHLGSVARLSPAIQESSRTLMVEAEVPNRDGDLRPGAFATASIVTSADQPAILVPVASILTFAGIEKVIIVVDGKTVERRVQTGRRTEGQVEILQGLQAGESVVVNPGNLVGGQAVAVVS